MTIEFVTCEKCGRDREKLTVPSFAYEREMESCPCEWLLYEDCSRQGIMGDIKKEDVTCSVESCNNSSFMVSLMFFEIQSVPKCQCCLYEEKHPPCQLKPAK